MTEDSSPSSKGANQLETAASSYLRSARHQPVQWHPWGEAAFERAKAEDKPILLDIGAVWCHWCHVMDRESYEDPEVANVINQHFVAVKVDRDERPDVDARYQAAVSAITGQGGWPLTAFLTPDGRPYFGGTYIPREDRYGRPGIGRVLLAMSQVWHERRDEALETAGSVMAAIEHNESFSGRGGDLTIALVDKIAGSALSKFDARNGGFGSQPKFPHAAALDLLLEIAMNRDNEQAREAFVITLEKMARGGVYDQLAGGFHRYSVDERWVVPHFEKMLYDNTELLRNYVHGFQSYVRQDFLETAKEIVGWLDSTMTDRERGGFYGSQDADVGLDDDGDYFTWTLEEAKGVLDPEELEFATDYWDIGELGDMHHNPAKNVLHVNSTLEERAARGGDLEKLRALRDSSKSKLLAARSLRPTPFIDRTLYTGWNAMAVTAYLETARVLRMDQVRDFALHTLNRLLNEAWDWETTLKHVIAYPDDAGSSEAAGRAHREQGPGTLDDYAFTVHACIDAWIASGNMNFYRGATMIADAMIARFYDKVGGAFFDSAASKDGAMQLGALGARRKPLQDSPTPAGNPTAASALLRLETLSGRREYRDIAEDTLGCFAGIVEHFGLYAGSYGLALERLLVDPVQVVVVGSGPEAGRLEATAMVRFAANKMVVRIAPHRLVKGGVPEALAETLLQVPVPAGVDVWAMVCHGRACLPPITDAETLLEAVETGT